MKLSKRYCCLFIFSFFTLLLSAQTQQGYVKTLGRSNQKGVALSGVSVRVKGGHNAVLSNTQGIFSMSMTGKKIGDAYALQQVQKQGYELKEKGVIGRQYAFSEKTTLTIVMVSSKQLQADKQRIENNAYKVAEKNYKSKLEQLEKQKASNAITIEQYRQQLQDLQDKFDKYQSLIDDLAEHYALVDYDDLDEKEQEINSSIEQGDLERANALLQQMGIQQRAEDIARRLAAGQQLMDEAQQDQAAVLKQQEKDAEYLYQLYTISLGRFDNEKARFYIETRAALDTTNVRWQIDAGEFLFENLNLFDSALSYFKKAENHAAKESLERAECLNDIATLYVVKGKSQIAQEYLQESFLLRQQLAPGNTPQMAIIYNSFATTSLVQGKVDEALSYHQKSLAIRREVYGENSVKVAQSYYNIGAVLIAKKDFDGAKEYIAKGLAIADKLNGDIPVALLLNLYNGMGSAISEKADAEGKPNPQDVITYYSKALDLCLQIYGEKNIRTASIYHNVGTTYVYADLLQVINNDTISVIDTKDIQKGLEYLVKSLEIKKELTPENDRLIKETENIIRLTAKTYYVLGFRNYMKHSYKRMALYFQQSKDIFKIASEAEDNTVIQSIDSILSQLK